VAEGQTCRPSFGTRSCWECRTILFLSCTVYPRIHPCISSKLQAGLLMWKCVNPDLIMPRASSSSLITGWGLDITTSFIKSAVSSVDAWAVQASSTHDHISMESHNKTKSDTQRKEQVTGAEVASRTKIKRKLRGGRYPSQHYPPYSECTCLICLSFWPFTENPLIDTKIADSPGSGASVL
jgi:hypothetical protein